MSIKTTLPTWWPLKPPIYSIEKSYQENLDHGPFFDGQIPKRQFPPKEKWIDFLGIPVASRLGVPAGPLLNGRWVTFAAQMGFDIVTYKTIRSRVHPAHPVPNMIYVDTHGPLTQDRFDETLLQAAHIPQDLSELAATNSFGIPSKDAAYLIEDIARADASLAPGQVMIVSIVGTPRPGEDFAEDFAVAANIALDGGAKIIEADFSCPNVASCEGNIYCSPQSVFDISKKVKETIGPIPLVIKVGAMTEKELLRTIMVTAARAGVEAICGINTVSMKVVKSDGTAALGAGRLKAGVCGGPIRLAALEFLRLAYAINQEERLNLTIMGTGGVTLPEHFDLFLEAGADIAMSAVGMMWDPYLAARYHERSTWMNK